MHAILNLQGIYNSGWIIYSDIERKVPWLKPDSPAHKVLINTICAPKNIKTLRMLNHGQHTGSLENLHSLMVSYAPKRTDFDPPGYIARVQLAIIDHNENISRPVQKGLYYNF